MIHGEAVVLRLLRQDAGVIGLEHLGMATRDRELFARVLEMPHGIVLVTGPTGSGKTTTLYARCTRSTTRAQDHHDRRPGRVSAQGRQPDPGRTEKTGLTFARGLRAILRHDPDVVLVGEIRDQETAEIAVQASLTGHLVFTTLHTNDAPGALTRLVDMGVEPYLVASSLEAVIAQRLVRVICADCKAADTSRAHARAARARRGAARRARSIAPSAARSAA